MRVLCIGDVHEPVAKDGYLEFCQDIYDAWGCNQVVFIGDLVDWHAISFHSKHPESPGAFDEYKLAYDGIQKWYKAFPKAKVCVGNHDARPNRLAATVNIPSSFLQSYEEMWNTPKWNWAFDHSIDGVYYFHGTGYSGLHPAYRAAREMGMSACIGHAHAAGGIKWLVNPNRRWFGMDVGCGIDDKRYAFAYGKHLRKKSVISCGVVIDGMPYHEMMPIEVYK